ncbi:MAG: holo-ACP synthase [Defluviitaleaceae bacterium]|nr:holo-ACP synthase [Defluviitaleaceae bacterium]
MTCGVDIVKIARFEDISDTFSRRVFTDNEREYIKSAQNAAGIFAAKEAVAKALGTGFNGISPRDIEILHEENGRPYVKMPDNKMTDAAIEISISHSETDAIAFAVRTFPPKQL